MEGLNWNRFESRGASGGDDDRVYILSESIALLN